MTFIKKIFKRKKSSLEDFLPIKEKLKEKKFVFVNLYSNSCLICKRTKPMIEEVSKKYPKVELFEVLIDEYSEKELRKYGIMFTPTLAFYDPSGQALHRSVGLIEKEKLEEIFSKAY